MGSVNADRALSFEGLLTENAAHEEGALRHFSSRRNHLMRRAAQADKCRSAPPLPTDLSY
jgi:hypothetical protein